jgi:competence protein ComEC
MAPALICGLLLGRNMGAPLWLICLGLALGIALIVGGQTRRQWKHSSSLFLLGIATVLVSLGTGYADLALTPAPDHLSRWSGKTARLRAEVLSAPRATRKGWRVEAEVLGLQSANDSVEHTASGKTWIYFNGAVPADLGTHDIVVADVTVRELQSTSDSFLRWMQNQGITHTAFSRTERPQVVGERNGIGPALTHLRESIVARMRAGMPDPQTSGFAVALMLGDRSGLDNEIKQDFSAAGLMHVLAISGMHVCLILVVLDGLIRAMSLTVRMRKVGELLALSLLLVYGVMSGASPAVMRAVIMVSLVLIARMAHLRTHSLNLLAVAALVQLLWNPGVLWDAGFQLSYAAMAGIMLLSKPWEKRLTAALPWLPTSISGNIAMTLAAQVATLPFICYHFGQFPTYFLLSNLATMFVASWAVRIGFFAMVFCFVPWVSTVLLGMLDFVLWVLIQICSLIAQLPGATVHKISVHDTGFCVLLAMLACSAGLVWLSWRKRKENPPKAPSLEELEEG